MKHRFFAYATNTEVFGMDQEVCRAGLSTPLQTGFEIGDII